MFNLSGAMGSYVAFYLAGMYPLPATGQILLSSPYFPQISFYNPVFNTTTTIIAKGFKGNPSSGTGGTVFVKVCSFCFVFSFLSGLISLTERHNQRKTLEIKLLSRLGYFQKWIHRRVRVD
jgi:hypothetical protein